MSKRENRKHENKKREDKKQGDKKHEYNLKEEIEKEVRKQLKYIVLKVNVVCKPEINVVNDTQREVAIGKTGVAAGALPDVAVAHENSSSAAGYNPDAANVGDDGTAQAADPNSAQALKNAQSLPSASNQASESGRGDLNQAIF
ncbi:hypothetical protein [Paenibacillus spongiae]|uniref:Uncharacterized protein n=1 Tax=Paenibacillus spongiae TaxID=2909671 RepID=A0ABY5S402_9BACL|nr:hypothetical protein [Paenibacillus spongiae]UVI28622.1 hypothetical protein L1F29_24700 [Paenibacillus spongiae]